MLEFIKECLWPKQSSAPLEAGQKQRLADAPWPDPHVEFATTNFGTYDRFAAMKQDLCEEELALLR